MARMMDSDIDLESEMAELQRILPSFAEIVSTLDSPQGRVLRKISTRNRRLCDLDICINADVADDELASHVARGLNLNPSTKLQKETSKMIKKKTQKETSDKTKKNTINSK